MVHMRCIGSIIGPLGTYCISATGNLYSGRLTAFLAGFRLSPGENDLLLYEVGDARYDTWFSGCVALHGCLLSGL